jgi:hypothetical protein|tara:strand:+ start:2270 stop:2623 length:354 start_codon:yes stop_codon:yes gene_type:complete
MLTEAQEAVCSASHERDWKINLSPFLHAIITALYQMQRYPWQQKSCSTWHRKSFSLQVSCYSTTSTSKKNGVCPLLFFEAVAQMDEEERRSILALLDAMILRHQAKRFFIPNTGPTG